MGLPATARALLSEDPTRVRVALVGASDAPHKYGHVIMVDLTSKGYEVLPVNPKADTVGGRPAVGRVSDLPQAPEIVNFVVPPAAALQVVEDLPDGPGPLLWFQPGAFDAQTVAAAEDKGYEVVAGPCIMVHAPAR